MSQRLWNCCAKLPSVPSKATSSGCAVTARFLNSSIRLDSQDPGTDRDVADCLSDEEPIRPVDGTRLARPALPLLSQRRPSFVAIISRKRPCTCLAHGRIIIAKSFHERWQCAAIRPIAQRISGLAKQTAAPGAQNRAAVESLAKSRFVHTKQFR